jgi:hypothetical protein
MVYGPGCHLFFQRDPFQVGQVSVDESAGITAAHDLLEQPIGEGLFKVSQFLAIIFECSPARLDAPLGAGSHLFEKPAVMVLAHSPQHFESAFVHVGKFMQHLRYPVIAAAARLAKSAQRHGVSVDHSIGLGM